MPRRLPSSALDQQTQITASSTGAILAGNWYIGTAGGGSGGAVAGTLTGPLAGNANTATAWKTAVTVNGTDLIGNVTPITIGVNTTSNPAAGTYYPLFVPSSSAGNQQASTSAASGFTFDPSTKNLVVAGTLSGSNLSGTNTGDQDLSSYAPKASPTFTGTVSTQDVSINRTGSNSYKLILNSNVAELQNYLTGYTLNWDYYRIIMSGDITLVRNFVRTPMSLASSGDLTIAGSYYGDGSHLTGISAPVTSVNGRTGAVTVSSPTAVSNLTQDNVIYWNNGIAWGMGATPGYTYTTTYGIVDDYLYVSVPTTGYWSFININILFKGDRIGCSANLSGGSANVIGSLDINAYGVGWTTISTKWWDSAQVNEIGQDGAVRYVGTAGSYYGGGTGIGGDLGNTSTLYNQQFEKPYYIQSGANIRFRILWSSSAPTLTQPAGYGTTSATFAHGSITIPAAQYFEWRAYPQPISYSGGYWHMGAAIVMSAVRVGT